MRIPCCRVAPVLLLALFHAGPHATGRHALRFQDFSGFTEFRHRATGCAVILDAVLSADITRTPEGDIHLSLAVAEPGVEGEDECVDFASAPGVPCIKETPLAERALTPTEVDAVLRTFSELEIGENHSILCAVCGSRSFSWDSATVNYSPCFPRYL